MNNYSCSPSIRNMDEIWAARKDLERLLLSHGPDALCTVVGSEAEGFETDGYADIAPSQNWEDISRGGYLWGYYRLRNYFPVLRAAYSARKQVQQ